MIPICKSTWPVSAAFFLIAVVVAILLYPELPAQISTHWDLQGNVNGTMPRFWGAVMPALMIFFLALLTLVLPIVSPLRFEIASFESVYTLLMLVVQASILVIGLSMLLAAAGYAVRVPTVSTLSIGVLLTVLGNHMGKLRKNFFIGIRTPWTLANAAVWERTHRLGGWVFVVTGMAVVVGAIAGLPPWLPLAMIALAALIPCVYSYVVYRRITHDV